MEERLEARLPTTRRVAAFLAGALLSVPAGELARRALGGRVAPWLAQGVFVGAAVAVFGLVRDYWGRRRPLGRAALEAVVTAGFFIGMWALWHALGLP